MIPFRVIAIAHSIERITRINSIAQFVADVPLGVMLRDPGHDRARQKNLVDFALELEWIGSTTLISNGFEHERIGWTHHTSAELARRVDSVGRASVVEIRPNSNRSSGLGFSTHSRSEVVAAVELNADYVTFGPIFRTGSKPGAIGTGVEMLAHIAECSPMSVFALGGIASSNIRDCLEAGAAGIASISLFAPENHHDLLRAVRLLDSP